MSKLKDANINIFVEGLSRKEESQKRKDFALTTQLELFIRDLLAAPVDVSSPSNASNSRKGGSK